MATSDDKNQQQPELQDGETFVPRQKPTAAASAAPTTNHPALQSGETFHPRTTQPAPPPESEDTDKTWGSFAGVPYKKSSFGVAHMLGEAGTGIGELAKGLKNTAVDVLNPELTPEQEKQGALGREGSRWSNLADKYIFNPADEQAKKAQTSTSPWESLGHSVAETLPIVGPWAANLGEQAGTGDVGGAIAKGVTQAAAVKFAPKLIGKAAKTVAKIPGGVSDVYSGMKYIGDVGKSLKEMHSRGSDYLTEPGEPTHVTEPAAAPAPEFKLTSPDLGKEEPIQSGFNFPEEPKTAKGTADMKKAPFPQAEIPAAGEIPAKANVNDLVDQLFPNQEPPLKSNVPLREQIGSRATMAQNEIPGAREIGGTTPEDQFQKSFGPEEEHVKGQAEWDTGNPHGTFPQPPSEKLPDQPRTSAHHVYGDEVGEELRDNPELQKYFNGKKGEGFTNVKARQAMINAGEDMGQQVVNSKQLQGEGAITPGQAVSLLRSKGYSLEEIRNLAEKKPKE